MKYNSSHFHLPVFLTFGLLLISLSLYAQDTTHTETDLVHYRHLTEPMIIANKVIYMPCGLKYAVGQRLKLGTGTAITGGFKYITISRNSLYNSTSILGDGLHGKYSGLIATIKRIEKYGNIKRGYSYYLIVGVGELINYEIDIDNAIKYGEITVPPGYEHLMTDRPKPTTTIINNNAPPISVADELLKLKKLLKDSIITQAEFDTQKKKLLDKN